MVGDDAVESSEVEPNPFAVKVSSKGEGPRDRRGSCGTPVSLQCTLGEPIEIVRFEGFWKEMTLKREESRSCLGNSHDVWKDQSVEHPWHQAEGV